MRLQWGVYINKYYNGIEIVFALIAHITFMISSANGTLVYAHSITYTQNAIDIYALP